MTEQGIVKWYSVAKGYGFIRRESDSPDSGEEYRNVEDSDAEESGDIFVHFSEVPDGGLAEGDRVSFELVESSRGLKARNVTRIKGSEG